MNLYYIKNIEWKIKKDIIKGKIVFITIQWKK